MEFQKETDLDQHKHKGSDLSVTWFVKNSFQKVLPRAESQKDGEVKLTLKINSS